MFTANNDSVPASFDSTCLSAFNKSYSLLFSSFSENSFTLQKKVILTSIDFSKMFTKLKKKKNLQMLNTLYKNSLSSELQMIL